MVVTVRYKGRPRSINQIFVKDTEPVEWCIKKRYLFCLWTNGDQPWAIRNYYKESLCDPRNQDPAQVKGARVKAVHTALHLQTNYEDLVASGLFDQDLTVFKSCLEPWYKMIGRCFPEFGEACSQELDRHIRAWHKHHLGKLNRKIDQKIA